MKYPLRALAAAFACSLGLASCGGDDSQDVQIQVAFFEHPDARDPSSMALLKDGLTIRNNNQTEVKVRAHTTAITVDWVALDSKFNVQILAQPPGVTCAPRNSSNTGTAGLYGITVEMVCTTKAHKIGGSINGLAGLLKLNNGGETLEVKPGTTSFTMPTTVRQTLPYGITVLAQPSNQTCTVINGTGIVVESDISNVVVNCVNNS